MVTFRREHLGILRRKAERRHEPLKPCLRQFGQRGLPFGQTRLVDVDGDEVGVGEVAVVVRLFLATHGDGDVLDAVVQARLLHDLVAIVQQVGLTGYLVLDGTLHMPERVQVLQFGACTELGGTTRTQRHVGVAPEAALLHVAVADAKMHHDGTQGLEIGHRLLRTSQVGFAHDFDERNPCTVEVDVAHVLACGVDVLARVVLEMDARDADALHRVAHGDVEMPMLADGLLVLRNLIPLGQVGIEVVLAGEDRGAIHGAPHGNPHTCGELHGLLVEHGQHTGHTGAHLADMGVGVGPEGRRTRTEQLRPGTQLGVDFKTDDGFVRGHGYSLPDTGCATGAAAYNSGLRLGSLYILNWK